MTEKSSPTPIGEVPAQAVDDALRHLNAALHRTLLATGLVTVEQWNAEIAPFLRSIASVVMRSPVHARTYRVHESIYPPKSPQSERSAKPALDGIERMRERIAADFPSDPPWPHESPNDKVYAAKDIEQIVTRLRDRCRVIDYSSAPNLIDDALEACEIIEQLCSQPSSDAATLHELLDGEVSRSRSMDAGKTWQTYTLEERVSLLLRGYKLANKELAEAIDMRDTWERHAAECQSRLAALDTQPSASGTSQRWRDTKVTVPCDGDDVLGIWLKETAGVVKMERTVMGVATYAGKGQWHEPEDDEDDYRAPDFWMPLPDAPTQYVGAKSCPDQ